MFTHLRSSTWATKSRSWSSISIRSVVVSRSVSSSASRTHGMRLHHSTRQATRFPDRSSRSRTSVFFIGLAGNIDGLVHLSDISWNETGEEAVRNYKKGDEIETVILSIDPERERISLGIKQLEEDSFSIYLGDADKGSIVTGEVTEVDAKGAVVKLNEEVDGYIKVADLSRDRVEDARSVLNVGDKVEAKIVNIDRKSRSIGLSIKAKDMDDEKEAVQSLKDQDSAASPGTMVI